MSTMEARRPLLTLVNEFTDPGRQQELAAAALAKFDPVLCEVVESIDRG